jgi:hypothetical protein
MVDKHMIGTCEIFDLRTSLLVHSSGTASRHYLERENLAEVRRYGVVRRLERGVIPRFRIISMRLIDFFDWIENDVPIEEALEYLPPDELNFLEEGDLI